MSITVDFASRSDISITSVHLGNIDTGRFWYPKALPLVGGAATSWSGIAFTRGRFVAVSELGNAANVQFMVSIDGWNWAYRTSPVKQKWSAIAANQNNGTLCACNWDGAIGVQFARSVDGGDTWVSVAAPIAAQWRGICWAGGSTWVAVNDNAVPASQIAISIDDGQSWASVASPCALTRTWRAVAADPVGGYVVAVSNTGAGDQIIRSADRGASWAIVAPPQNTARYGICFGPLGFVAVASGNQMDVSDPTGTTFVIANSLTGVGGNSWAVCYSAELGRYCSILNASSSVASGISPNGMDWSWTYTYWSSLYTAPYFRAITYGNGRFVAMSRDAGLDFGVSL